jgi:transcriptional regulator with XRE-family HTH domain
MQDYDLRALRSLRAFLIRSEGRVKVRRAGPEKADLRRHLDEASLVFRVARKTAAADRRTAADTGSWLRAVRQAVGIPVDEVARRLGVIKWEVFRLEKAERDSRIVMATLRRAADALGCELIYALIPREGSLEDLAAQQRRAWEEARERARKEEYKRKEEIEDWMDWRPTMRRFIRREFRKHGIRVR